jgi:hypothetical protein
MVEKFGKLVHLEKVEGAIVNLQIEELKQKLDDAGDEFYNTMAQYEVYKRNKQTDSSRISGLTSVGLDLVGSGIGSNNQCWVRCGFKKVHPRRVLV